MKERKYKYLVQAIAEMPKYDRRNGYYVEVLYDMEKDEVYNHVHVSLGHNNWTEYHDDNVIRIGNFAQKVTKAQLKELIEEKIAWDERVNQEIN